MRVRRATHGQRDFEAHVVSRTSSLGAALTAAALTPLRTVSRIAAALVGGWAFTWGFVSLAITGLVALGQPYNEAHTAAMLLAFIVFLVALCWVFAAVSLARVWVVLAGGAALMTSAAWLLQRGLI
jgi:hypothetical protein